MPDWPNALQIPGPLGAGDGNPNALNVPAGGAAWLTGTDAVARQRAYDLANGLRDPVTGNLTPAGWEAQRQALLMGFGPADIGAIGLGLIKNYHGSPHLFPPTPKNPLGEFRLDRIGTGEGSQVYGQGAYTAGREGTSETYLGPNAGWQYGGIKADKIYDRLNQSAQERNLDNAGWSDLNARRGFWEQVVLGRAPRQIIEDAATNPHQYGEADLAYINSLDPTKFQRTGGHMYEVNLHAEPHEFLHWDKPLSEQNPAALGAVSELAARAGLTGDLSRYGNAGDVFKTAEGRVGPARAAEILRDAGIPGIRYLDQGSRELGPNHPDATYNHVMLDPEKMEIIRRFGIAGLLGGGAAAAASGQDQGNQ